MFTAKASRFAAQVKNVAVQSSRNMSVLSGPPTEKISAAEKLVHGMAMVVGIMAVPSWVLLNLQNYKGE